MSIWKEIKHALNSTLGTDSFQPLDQYLRSTQTINYTTYSEIITNADNGTQYMLYKGKTALCCKTGDKTNYQTKYPNYTVFATTEVPITLLKIKMLTAGSILIADEARKDSGSYTTSRSDSWYENLKVSVGDKIYTLDPDDTNYWSYKDGISYKKGDTIRLYLDETDAEMRSDYSSGNDLEFTPCIYGKTSDTSSIEYLNWEEASE